MFEARAAPKDDGGGAKDGRAARDRRARDRLDLAQLDRGGVGLASRRDPAHLAIISPSIASQRRSIS
jgi:hypothetical protein